MFSGTIRVCEKSINPISNAIHGLALKVQINHRGINNNRSISRVGRNFT